VAKSRLLPVVMRTSPSVLNSTTTSGSVGGVGANENQLKYFTASGHSSGGLNIGFQLDAEL